jgi:hypothetical protein
MCSDGARDIADGGVTALLPARSSGFAPVPPVADVFMGAAVTVGQRGCGIERPSTIDVVRRRCEWCPALARRSIPEGPWRAWSARIRWGRGRRPRRANAQTRPRPSVVSSAVNDPGESGGGVSRAPTHEETADLQAAGACLRGRLQLVDRGERGSCRGSRGSRRSAPMSRRLPPFSAAVRRASSPIATPAGRGMDALDHGHASHRRRSDRDQLPRPTPIPVPSGSGSGRAAVHVERARSGR